MKRRVLQLDDMNRRVLVWLLTRNVAVWQALGCDEAARLEAHRWCVNGLLAFNRYGDGDPGPGGVRNHSFQVRLS